MSLGQHLGPTRSEVDQAPSLVARIGEPFDKPAGLQGDQHLVGGLRAVHAVEGKVRPGGTWLYLDEPQDPEPGRADPERPQCIFERQPQRVLGLPEKVPEPTVRTPEPLANSHRHQRMLADTGGCDADELSCSLIIRNLMIIGGAVARFRISTHGRLQDWIADDKGYFADEGLDYQINLRVLENADQDIARADKTDVRVGAYELYQSGGGGKKDMSCACHWAVNEAATQGAGRMWGHCYSILPSGIYVRQDSAIRSPEDLAGVDVAVGYHSGSHFSTIQALEAFLDPGGIKLGFIGMPYDRVDALLAGAVPAAAAWSAPAYILEQFGCRKVLDTTFIAGFMFGADTDVGDVRKYFSALKRAQMDLDLEPERYKTHYGREIPSRYAGRVDVRRFGPGERIVFLPYSKDMYQQSQQWMHERGLFGQQATAPLYESAIQL